MRGFAFQIRCDPADFRSFFWSMSESRPPYPFAEFEPKWQARWEREKTFRTPGPRDDGFDPSKPKFYVLDMFPYPSGAGLHVGHPEGYTATDIVARHKRMTGHNVLHPMGYDSFGLPAEQYAIKTGQHPAVTTAENIANFRRQLKALGFAYDWDREIATTDPEYVRWTQWIFLQIYHSYYCEETQRARPVAELEAQGFSRQEIDARRLAYVADTPVWWSPDLGTVLANEEVEEWKAKGHTVERRPLRQWMLRITAYAQRLIDDLDLLDWPEGVRLLQKNWIGRSEGAEVEFLIGAHSVRVFTTRADTLFGATYMVLAPEHPLVPQITTQAQLEAVDAYRKSCAAKSDLERGDLNKDKSGVFTGAHAVNPVNGESIPVWIADYVMMGYGTGAIMAVPAHDERDFEFATKFGLEVRQVVQPSLRDETKFDPSALPMSEAFCEPGIAVNSGFLDGLPTPEARKCMLRWLESNQKGSRRVQYKLRDWLFSRQRYWGEPFPIVWKDGLHHALPESELPLLAPPLEDYRPGGSPEPLLNKASDWVHLPDGSIRETNTMPQWAGSCWYYLRYCDPSNTNRFLSKEAEAYWSGWSQPNPPAAMVDLYVGGTEHAVLHLLYARFWHKVLFDLRHVSTPEPFRKLVNQGLILGEDGQKMSKSRGNVVNPDDVIRQYGADALRLYEMFMGPLEQVKPWQMKGVEGVSRFLARVWRLALVEEADGVLRVSPKIRNAPCTDRELLRVVHETIRKVGEDIGKLCFNTAISQMMICTNAFMQAEFVPLDEFIRFLTVLHPFAPHITEEIAERLHAHDAAGGSARCLSESVWPAYDPAALESADVEFVIQVNGKLRDRIRLAKDAIEEIVHDAAMQSPKVREHLEQRTIRKIVFVPGKLLNIVVA
jgi:leucyl-tRNA synthetase